MPTKKKTKKYVVPRALRKEINDGVKFLIKNPKKINSAFLNPRECKGGILFRFIHPSPLPLDEGWVTRNGDVCGCPILVKDGTTIAYTKRLTDHIRGNKSLPFELQNMTPDHLRALGTLALRVAVAMKWKK